MTVCQQYLFGLGYERQAGFCDRDNYNRSEQLFG